MICARSYPYSRPTPQQPSTSVIVYIYWLEGSKKSSTHDRSQLHSAAKPERSCLPYGCDGVP